MKKILSLFILALIFISSVSASLDPTLFLDTASQVGHPLLAPTLGVEVLETSILENIRFMDDFKPGVLPGKGRNYTNDSVRKYKDGHSNNLWRLVKLFFPSNSGTFYSYYLGNSNFAYLLSREPSLQRKVAIIGELLLYATTKRTYEAKGWMEHGSLSLPKKKSILQSLQPLEENFQRVIEEIMKAIDGTIFAEPKSPYPVGMPELVILAFFAHQFTEPHSVPLLVSYLKERLPEPTAEQRVITKLMDEAYRAIVTARKEKLAFMPYLTTNLIQNGRMTPYDRATSELKGEAHADCAEEAIRHLINLVAYDPHTGTLRLPQHLPATPFLPALRHFLEFEGVKNVNNGSEAMRNAWSKVVGDLNTGAPLSPLGPITYLQNKSTSTISGDLFDVARVLERLFAVPLPSGPLPETWDEEAWKAWFDQFFTNFVKLVNPPVAPHIKISIPSIKWWEGTLCTGSLELGRFDPHGNLLYKFSLYAGGSHLATRLHIAQSEEVPIPMVAGQPINFKPMANKKMTYSLLLLPFFSAEDLDQNPPTFFTLLYARLLNDSKNQKRFLQRCAHDETLIASYAPFIRRCLEDVPWSDEIYVLTLKEILEPPLPASLVKIIESVPEAARNLKLK